MYIYIHISISIHILWAENYRYLETSKHSLCGGSTMAGSSTTILRHEYNRAPRVQVLGGLGSMGLKEL